MDDRDSTVMAHSPLVESCARKIASRLGGCPVVDVDDLKSEGYIALLGAFDRYSPDTGVTFGAYAKVRVFGRMLDFLRRVDHLPKGKRRLHKRLVSDLDQLSQELQRPVNSSDVDELESHHGIKLSDASLQPPETMGQSLAVGSDDREEILAYVRVMVGWESRKWVQCMLAWHFLGGMSLTQVSRHLNLRLTTVLRAYRLSLCRLRDEMETSA